MFIINRSDAAAAKIGPLQFQRWYSLVRAQRSVLRFSSSPCPEALLELLLLLGFLDL